MTYTDLRKGFWTKLPISLGLLSSIHVTIILEKSDSVFPMKDMQLFPLPSLFSPLPIQGMRSLSLNFMSVHFHDYFHAVLLWSKKILIQWFYTANLVFAQKPSDIYGLVYGLVYIVFFSISVFQLLQMNNMIVLVREYECGLGGSKIYMPLLFNVTHVYVIIKT